MSINYFPKYGMRALNNKWNSGVSLLRTYFGDTHLATGTCFFWRHEGRTFLVTNWHNLTGRNHLTGGNISQNGGRPDHVEVWVYRKVDIPLPPGTPATKFAIRHEALRLKICEPDLTGILWFHHPVFGSKVDIGALDVTDNIQGLSLKAVNDIEDDAVMNLEVSQDVFVLGFPFGQMNGLPAPVWKRGTLASDPSFDIDNLPKVLIDTATREGMSGSPVVARNMIFGDYKKKDGAVQDVIVGMIDTVMGIYSGRHYPDLEKAQLGIVWKRSAIEETVAAMQLAVLPP